MVNPVFSGIANWSATNTYNVNDVTLLSGTYYFCSAPNINNNPNSSPNCWFSQNTFNWPFSYATQPEIDTPINETQFGDSYVQRMPKGLGTVRFKPISIKIDKLDDKTAFAISVFLSNPNNIDYFNFYVPAPHNKQITVSCASWSIEKVYDNNHSLTATFEEYLDYQYQPLWNYASGTNPNAQIETEIVSFLAMCVQDNLVHYVTARAQLFPDNYASAYVPQQADTILPYLNGGNFIQSDGSCYTAVLKGLTDNTYLSNPSVFTPTANSLYSGLNASGFISGTEFIQGYYLDGRVVYLRVDTDRIEDGNPITPAEEEALNNVTTLQFFPFQSTFNSDPNLYTGVSFQYAYQNMWATMTLGNALNFWYDAYYFGVMSPYGGAVTLNFNETYSNPTQSGLTLLYPQTFTVNGQTIGGIIYGYCWLTSGYSRYFSQISGLDGNSQFTGILNRSILQSGACILAQVQIPICYQYVQGTGTGILGVTSQGTLGTSGSGIEYGNPTRGISSISFDNTSKATCVQGPNLWNWSGNKPIQTFPSQPYPFSYNSQIPYPADETVIFDGTKTMCMCAIPASYFPINAFANLSGNYGTINRQYLTNNPGSYYQLYYSGVPTGGNLNNSCGLQLIVTTQSTGSIPYGLCLDPLNP